jgi:uncharacterized repeat protein (TIGR01451 family)
MKIKKHTSLCMAVIYVSLLVLAGYAQFAEAATVRATLAHPTGDRGTSVVVVQMIAPSETVSNKPFDMTIDVTNVTNDVILEEVKLMSELSSNFVVNSSDPAAQGAAGKYEWSLGTLQPRESREIKINAQGADLNALEACIKITYIPVACLKIDIVQPGLALVKKAPAEVLICDPIPLTFVVSNPGSGLVENVRITDPLPDGLATMDNRRSVSFDAGTLQPGQSRDFSVTVKATRTGTFTNVATATANGGLTAESTTTTIVREPVLTITKTGTERTTIGSNIDYRLGIGNTGDAAATDSVLEDIIPSGTTFVSASDGGQFENGRVVWNFGSVEINGSRSVSLTVRADQIGRFRNTARYTAVCATPVAASFETEVIGVPDLTLVKEAPTEVVICDPIPLKLTVTNPGTGALTNVSINDPLPNGLVTDDGKTVVNYNVGTLQPGQSREYYFQTKALRTGSYTNTATATAEGGLSVNSTTTTNVHEPVLAITKTANREWQYLNRNVTFNMSLVNNGDWVAANTLVEDVVPSNSEFVSASQGGEYSAADHKVRWNFGDMQPGANQNFSITVKATQFGLLRNTVGATAVCAKPVAASAQVEIRGVPAVLLEVIDVNDPIQIGDNEIYTITVTNQGTLDALDVTVIATIQPEGEHVSNSGASAGSVAGKTVSFTPIPRLAPKAKVEWKVTVKAISEGDTRFTVSMKTRRLTTTVDETESTEFYQ